MDTCLDPVRDFSCDFACDFRFRDSPSWLEERRSNAVDGSLLLARLRRLLKKKELMLFTLVEFSMHVLASSLQEPR